LAKDPLAPTRPSRSADPRPGRSPRSELIRTGFTAFNFARSSLFPERTSTVTASSRPEISQLFVSQMEGYAISSHFRLFRVDAAWPRLGRAFRTAPVSRQTDPNLVWHSPRFHSRPATLLRPPFCPFHRSVLFLPAAAQVKKETSRKRQKGKKHEIR